jgi:hypothetical protein
MKSPLFNYFLDETGGFAASFIQKITLSRTYVYLDQVMIIFYLCGRGALKPAIYFESLTRPGSPQKTGMIQLPSIRFAP